MVLTAILAFILPVIIHYFIKENITVKSYLLNVIKLFSSLLPIVLLSRRNFLFKDGPLKSTILILYYLILLPFINLSLQIKEDEALKYLYLTINGINIIFLTISHILLLKYVFNDFFMRRRSIIAGDILVVFTTYITIAITFGLCYTLLSIYSDVPCFSNINQPRGSLQYYFQHIYFSFITIATVGYGDVIPLSPVAKFLTIVEVLIGMLMTNVILGLIIGSGIFAIQKGNKK